jgi:xylan 1,4-beta-xylosidase
MLKFNIDAKSELKPFPHFWERCIFGGHASLALRDDWRKHLKVCHDELGFQFVRLHGIFNDDTGIFRIIDGQKHLSFYNLDNIFDFIVGIGMKPMISLSFMPADMASGKQKNLSLQVNITPPKNFSDWGDLVKRFIGHIQVRYGKAEVRSWLFEVWNEPNSEKFWAGTKEEYFQLYAETSRTIKKIDEEIKIGGPASAAGEWISEFLEFAHNEKVMVDFITTHQFPINTVANQSLNLEFLMAAAKREALKNMSTKAKNEALGLPLFITEWNCSPGSRDVHHDEMYMPAFIIKTISDQQGLADVYAFRSMTDIFDEDGFPTNPFHGGSGLLNIYGIPKPAFHAFDFLNQLEGGQIAVKREHPTKVEVLAFKSESRIQLLVYLHDVPFSPMKEEILTVEISGLAGFKDAWLKRIDETHGNPRKRWLDMGSPRYLSLDEIRMIIVETAIQIEPVELRPDADLYKLEISIPPHGVAFIEINL